MVQQTYPTQDEIMFSMTYTGLACKERPQYDYRTWEAMGLVKPLATRYPGA